MYIIEFWTILGEGRIFVFSVQRAMQIKRVLARSENVVLWIESRLIGPREL